MFVTLSQNTGGVANGYGPGAQFASDLQTTLVPRSSGGSSTPTFTRASTAYQTDFENKANIVLSGETRFQGARRVYNLIPAAGTGSASLAIGANKTVTVGVGTFVFSMGAVATADSVITFTGTATGLPVGTLTANATKRTSVAMTITVGGTVIMTASGAIAVDLQLENTTDQANQNPSEYVSIGVLSAPYHGAGVDGVKYFSTLNGNTVASNVVTEATGAAIVAGVSGVAATAPVDAGGPYGFWSEGARADVLGATAAIRRTMTDVGWVNGGTVTVGAAVGVDGVADAAASITGGAVTATNTILFTTVLGAAVRTYSAWIRRKTGTGTIEITKDGGVGWTDITATLTTAYKQFEVTTASAANPIVGFRITTNLDAIEVDFNTLEAATFANPTPIPLNVSKAADVLTYPVAGNFNTAEGTVYAEWTSAVPTGTAPAIIGDGASANQFPIYINGSTKASTYDGTNVVQAGSAITLPTTTIHKAAMSWSGSTLSGSSDGSVAATGTFDGSMGITTIAIGFSNAASTYLFGSIRNVRTYPKAPSAAQLAGMTA